MKYIAYILICAVWAVPACKVTHELINISLLVEVTDDNDKPVQNAEIYMNRVKNLTDISGSLSFALKGKEGAVIPVSIKCPSGYSIMDQHEKLFFIKKLVPIEGSKDKILQDVIKFRCMSETKSHVLVVRTNEIKGLPVLVTGKKVAETDNSGVAQVAIKGPPGEEVEIVIDTSARSDLKPQMPSRQLQLPVQSRFIVFDQSFYKNVKKIKKRRPEKYHRPKRL
jgi:hypothetical protein